MGLLDTMYNISPIGFTNGLLDTMYNISPSGCTNGTA